MTYTSFGFYIFLLLVLVLYYVVPLKFRWMVLLAGSIVFYFQACRIGWWILFASILLTYAAGVFLDYLGEKYPSSEKMKKTVFITAVVFVVSPWFVVKNGDFF